MMLVVNEARQALLTAVIAGFGRAIAEVGAVMIVGGNIAGDTRVLTTSIVLWTGKGEFDKAIALGLILLALSFSINLLVKLHGHQRRTVPVRRALEGQKMSFISVRGLYRRRGGKTILKDINLELEKGEVLGIIGPSGAGKTSLLRCINMLDQPDAGSISIDGRDLWVGDRLAMQRSMAMVFQKPLPFSMSVYDNIAYGMKLRGMSRETIDGAVTDVLKLLDMTG